MRAPLKVLIVLALCVATGLLTGFADDIARFLGFEPGIRAQRTALLFGILLSNLVILRWMLKPNSEKDGKQE